MPTIKSQPIIPPATSANLDVLRSIAVLCVFVDHLLDTVTRLRWGSLGRFGVILFFVHASLVLMYSLDRVQHAPGPFSASPWHSRFGASFASIPSLSSPFSHPHPPPPPRALHLDRTQGLISNLTPTQNLTGNRGVLGVLGVLGVHIERPLMLVGNHPLPSHPPSSPQF